MKRKRLAIPFEYMDTPERRVLSLEKFGFPCVPVLGLSRYNNTRPFLEKHRHPECIEISLCVRAPLVFKCEGKSYKLMPGQIFVTQPKDLHHLVTNPKGLFLYWMFFRIPPKGQSLLGIPPDESAALVKSLRGLPHRLSASADIKSLFAELFNVYDAELSPADKRLAYRTTLLRLLTRMAASTKKETQISADKRLSEIASTIKDNPHLSYTVPDLAEMAFMSESVFNARFKKLTGYPPHAFVSKCKLDAISQLLERGSTPISILASKFGYHSSQHLAGQFKSAFGMTMREWRSHRSKSTGLSRDPIAG